MSSQTQLARITPKHSQIEKQPEQSGSQLSKKHKAAIIVRFLLNEGAEVSLSDLPDAQQVELTYLMGRMAYIDRNTLGDVLLEFAHELESIGLSFPGGVSGALSALEGRISPMTSARLRKEAGVRQIGDPWDRLRALSIPELQELVEAESIEVAAVTVSKLDVGKAAELLSSLPGEMARRITYAVSLTGAITPEAVDRIGLTLASQMDDVPPKAFVDAPVDRVGAILNSSTAATRDDLLSALEETDADFAEKVRKTIFTYAHIPARVEARDIPRVAKEIDDATLVTALGYATEGEAGATTEFLLDSISSRLADQLRESIEERGTVPSREGEAALSVVTTVIRELESAGDLKLIAQDEGEE
ncbi:FliG C-terminal domain-containing protein [Shimia sp.]|uniref:flagellar motor switch protein FliG n=1 Tax=Shimia sp. TaxID=1954381 RepID=UPI003297DFBD